MKTALILTGHLRCWHDVFPSFKEKVINRYNPDIFIHTWNEEGWWIPGEEQNQKGYYEKTPIIIKKDIIKAYNPKDIVIEDWNDYNSTFEQRGKFFQNYAHRPKNILSMFYKLNRGVSMMENYVSRTGEFYDLVIRMRPDLIFHEDFPEFDNNKFYTLAHRNHLAQGTGDMIQIGNMMDIIMFSKISCFMTHIYLQTQLLCPHIMSQVWIQHLRFNWQEFFIRKTIQHTPYGQYVEIDKKDNYDNNIT